MSRRNQLVGEVIDKLITNGCINPALRDRSMLALNAGGDDEDDDEEECPKCGGEMSGGKCGKCGYVENRRSFTANMPAGGAFEGAKSAGFSPAQAAAMAGKLEGSYTGSGSEKTSHGALTKSQYAKAASSHAEKTKSKSAHKAAATAHKDAAKAHDEEGATGLAQSHHTQARSHAAKAARMTRNEQAVRELVDAGLISEVFVDQAVMALNAKPDSSMADLSGSMGSNFDGQTEQAGGEEKTDDDDQDGAGGSHDALGGSKKGKKIKGAATMNEWLSNMPPAAQAVWNTAQRLEQQERNRLVGQLQHIANSSPPAKKKLILNKLQAGMNVEQMTELIQLVGVPVSNSAPPRQRETGMEFNQGPTFVGAAGGPDGLLRNSANSEDRQRGALLVPTINMAETAQENMSQAAIDKKERNGRMAGAR